MRRSVWIHLPPATLFLALTLWVCWPLWWRPAARLESLGDPQLNAYLLSWSQYAIFHQLPDFFDANMFWPRADALAYGEHLLAPAILALPARFLIDSPAAGHNISLIQGIFFCALAAYALGWHWFRNIGAATVAGLVYGFAAYRLNQTAHLQLVHGEFLPLSILGVDWILAGGRRRRRRGRRLLGLGVLGQALCSWYWAVYAFWTVVPYLIGRGWTLRKHLSRTRFRDVVVPLLIACVLAAPMVWPYIKLKHESHLVRPPETMIAWSARPGDFLKPHPRHLIYAHWARDPGDPDYDVERNLFMGIGPWIGLIVAAGVWLRRRRIPQSRHPQSAGHPFPLGLWLILTLVFIVFCFGDHWIGADETPGMPMPHRLISTWFPGADQMRVPARWMLPAMLGLSLLTAAAWQSLFVREGRHFRRTAAGGAAIALLLAESLTRPIDPAHVRPDRPEIYRWLEAQSYPSPILLLPVRHRTLMLDLAWHHQPAVNGSNGYFPPGYINMMMMLREFPSPESVEILKAVNVRYVIVDLIEDRSDGDAWAARLRQFERKYPGSFVGARQDGQYMNVELPVDTNQDPIIPEL